jgi:hypothetical protein
VGAAEALGGSTFGILVELVVPHPKDRPALLREERVAPQVARGPRMLAAIELDDQFGLPAGEVREVRPDRELPGELRPQARDDAPELALVPRRAIAQLTRALGAVDGHGGSCIEPKAIARFAHPPPPPPFQGGEQETGRSKADAPRYPGNSPVASIHLSTSFW